MFHAVILIICVCMHMQKRDWVRDEGERDLELKEKSFDVVAIKKKIGPHVGKGTSF